MGDRESGVSAERGQAPSRVESLGKAERDRRALRNDDDFDDFDDDDARVEGERGR